jgi:hypothetical protein
VRRETPSGFRPVTPVSAPEPPSPAPPPVLHVQKPALNKPTLAGGFMPMAPPHAPTVPHAVGSEPATLETKKLVNADAVLQQHEPQQPQPRQYTQHPQTPWPPPHPAFAPPPQQQLPPPVLHPAPRRSLAWVIVLAALLGFVVVAGIGVGLFVVRARSAGSEIAGTATTSTSTATAKPTATATVTATHTATATTAMATSTATATATATATVTATTPSNLPTPGPNEGVLILPASAQGHRIFVDGRVKGDGSGPLVIACGAHTVQIGSAGKPRDVNVPCGALAKLE